MQTIKELIDCHGFIPDEFMNVPLKIDIPSAVAQDNGLDKRLAKADNVVIKKRYASDDLWEANFYIGDTLLCDKSLTENSFTFKYTYVEYEDYEYEELA